MCNILTLCSLDNQTHTSGSTRLLLLFLLNLAWRRVVGRRGVATGVAGARLFGLDAALGVGGGRGRGRRVGVGGGGAALALLLLLLLRRRACATAG